MKYRKKHIGNVFPAYDIIYIYIYICNMRRYIPRDLSEISEGISSDSIVFLAGVITICLSFTTLRFACWMLGKITHIPLSDGAKWWFTNTRISCFLFNTDSLTNHEVNGNNLLNLKRTWNLNAFLNIPSKIEWDLTNRPLSKLLELVDTQLSVQWVLLEIFWI